MREAEDTINGLVKKTFTATAITSLKCTLTLIFRFPKPVTRRENVTNSLESIVVESFPYPSLAMVSSTTTGP